MINIGELTYASILVCLRFATATKSSARPSHRLHLTAMITAGYVAPFPPLSTQPYPPARIHPRWKGEHLDIYSIVQRLILKLSESYRLHDTWIMKVSCSSSHYEGNADVYPQHWPFQTETKRAKLPSTKLAGFIAWGESPFAPCLSSPSFIRAAAPYADFDRLVWASRLTGLLILEDDLVNNEDHSTERIAGFKHVAAGNGVSVIIHKWRHRY